MSCPECGSKEIDECVEVRISYDEHGNETNRKYYGTPLYFCSNCGLELGWEVAKQITDGWSTFLNKTKTET